MKPAWTTLGNMASSFIAFLPQLLVAIAVFLAFLLIAKAVRVGVRRSLHEELAGVLGQVAFGAVLVLGALVATGIMGVGITSLLAGLGVSGFVIGFALKDILENYIAGILLMVARPFEPGDEIKSGAFEGTVRCIETRSTTILTFDGRHVIIPNAQIFSSPLVNETRNARRQSVMTLKVGSERLPETTQRILDTLRQVPGVLAEPAPEVRLLGAGRGEVELEVSFWHAAAQAAKRQATHLAALSLQQTLHGVDTVKGTDEGV